MSCKTTPLHDGGTAAVFCIIAWHNRIREDTIMANLDYQSNGRGRFLVHCSGLLGVICVKILQPVGIISTFAT